MKTLLQSLLTPLNIHPILMDIGSAGYSPIIWNKIAENSIYIGFDPDVRVESGSGETPFYKSFIVNKAVTANLQQETSFNLTYYPSCSSVLPPDSQSLKEFLFSDLFQVEKTISIPTITINEVLENLELKQIDWFKTDSQGTDLRLFNSIREDIRSNILAVDVEPGLINAYQGEDLFIDVHQDLVKQGFWLSNLNVVETVKFNRNLAENLQQSYPEITLDMLRNYHKKTPGWCEARYLRTLDFMIAQNWTQREYILLWLFSLLDQQIGFSFNLLNQYELQWGKDQFYQEMYQESLLYLKAILPKHQQLKKVLKQITPPFLIKAIKSLLN